MKLKILDSEGTNLYKKIINNIKINKGVLYTKFSRHN